MTTKKKIILGVFGAAILATGGFVAVGCRPTTHAVEPATMGETRSANQLETILSQPGPVVVETVTGADWEVARAGLINLDNPKAKAAKLEDGAEPIQIYFHALHHPTKGLYIVDTGVEQAMRDDPKHAAIQGIVASAMHTDKIHVRNDLAGWLAKQSEPLAGVFLTHVHLDHVSGMRDVPKGTPIFIGPGDTTERSWENAFIQPVMDKELDGQKALSEWQFHADEDGVFDGILDVFGDASVFAIWVPGHTPGSTAYLVRTPTGPVLLVGDACHTAWGWENGVEPGWFSDDKPKSARSLGKLRDLVARHPEISVRLGHQSLVEASGGDRKQTASK